MVKVTLFWIHVVNGYLTVITGLLFSDAMLIQFRQKWNEIFSIFSTDAREPWFFYENQFSNLYFWEEGEESLSSTISTSYEQSIL